jgi:hypothetical protein
MKDIYIIELTEVIAEYLVASLEEITGYGQTGRTDAIPERVLANDSVRRGHQQVLAELAVRFRATTIVPEFSIPGGCEGNREVPLDKIT